MSLDYSPVTERPGLRVTREGLSRAYTRYAFAARLCKDKDVLEIACGAGLGLGYLADHARRIVAGDLTDGLLRVARRHYGPRIPLVRFDAHALPFGPASFDAIVCHEAVYYLDDPPWVFREARRILRVGGTFIVCSVNCCWADFHPSQDSIRYLAASELERELRRSGFDVELYGGFRVNQISPRARVTSFVKRTAVKLNLIPASLSAREPLKRLFLGPLVSLPADVRDGVAVYDAPVPLNGSERDYKILYAVGHAV